MTTRSRRQRRLRKQIFVRAHGAAPSESPRPKSVRRLRRTILVSALCVSLSRCDRSCDPSNRRRRTNAALRIIDRIVYDHLKRIGRLPPPNGTDGEVHAGAASEHRLVATRRSDTIEARQIGPPLRTIVREGRAGRRFRSWPRALSGGSAISIGQTENSPAAARRVRVLRYPPGHLMAAPRCRIAARTTLAWPSPIAAQASSQALGLMPSIGRTGCCADEVLKGANAATRIVDDVGTDLDHHANRDCTGRSGTFGVGRLEELAAGPVRIGPPSPGLNSGSDRRAGL